MANFTIHILFIIHLRWMARSVQSATGYIACEIRNTVRREDFTCQRLLSFIKDRFQKRIYNCVMVTRSILGNVFVILIDALLASDVL